MGVFQSYKLLLGSHEVDKVGIFPATYVEFADKSAVAATPPKPSYRRSMALSSVSAIPNKDGELEEPLLGGYRPPSSTVGSQQKSRACCGVTIPPLPFTKSS